jgi:hypothetical protein
MYHVLILKLFEILMFLQVVDFLHASFASACIEFFFLLPSPDHDACSLFLHHSKQMKMREGDPIRFIKSKYFGKTGWKNIDKVPIMQMVYVIMNMGHGNSMRQLVGVPVGLPKL